MILAFRQRRNASRVVEKVNGKAENGVIVALSDFKKAEDIRCFVEKPIDEYGNVRYGYYVIMAKIIPNKDPLFSKNTEYYDKLEIIKPGDFKNNYSRVLRGHFVEVTGVKTGKITFKKWCELTGFKEKERHTQEFQFLE